jgi:ribosome recycling factor
MSELISEIIEESQMKMDDSISHLEKVLSKIRAGKASTAMVDGVNVDYYGSMTPLSQVSNISTPDAKTIAIQPWEKSLIQEIEKAIIDANLGFAPDNNGEVIRITIPPMTEERRRDIVKQVKDEVENAKVSIRSNRQDANKDLKKLKDENVSEDLIKDAESDVQNMTNDYNSKIDEIFKEKEVEVMSV